MYLSIIIPNSFNRTVKALYNIIFHQHKSFQFFCFLGVLLPNTLYLVYWTDSSLCELHTSLPGISSFIYASKIPFFSIWSVVIARSPPVGDLIFRSFLIKDTWKVNFDNHVCLEMSFFYPQIDWKLGCIQNYAWKMLYSKVLKNHLPASSLAIENSYDSLIMSHHAQAIFLRDRDPSLYFWHLDMWYCLGVFSQPLCWVLHGPFHSRNSYPSLPKKVLSYFLDIYHHLIPCSFFFFMNLLLTEYWTLSLLFSTVKITSFSFNASIFNYYIFNFKELLLIPWLFLWFI